MKKCYTDQTTFLQMIPNVFWYISRYTFWGESFRYFNAYSAIREWGEFNKSGITNIGLVVQVITTQEKYIRLLLSEVSSFNI